MDEGSGVIFDDPRRSSLRFFKRQMEKGRDVIREFARSRYVRLSNHPTQLEICRAAECDSIRFGVIYLKEFATDKR